MLSLCNYNYFCETTSLAIDSPCEYEHNNPDSLDARLFSSVVLAVAPAVTMDEASSLLLVTWLIHPFRLIGITSLVTRQAAEQLLEALLKPNTPVDAEPVSD